MPDRPARVVPGAPPPGTLHKRPRPSTAFAHIVERARQPTGGWKVGDCCMTPTGRLCTVVSVHELMLDLQYVQESSTKGRPDVDVSLRPYLCRWLSPREVKALKQPERGYWNEGGTDAAA
jgi:hypothetical protein